MRTESLTWYCDAKGCRESRTTSLASGEIGAHLDLVEAGWAVSRFVTGAWKHYCPSHTRKEDRDE